MDSFVDITVEQMMKGKAYKLFHKVAKAVGIPRSKRMKRFKRLCIFSEPTEWQKRHLLLKPPSLNRTISVSSDWCKKNLTRKEFTQLFVLRLLK